MQKIDRGRLVEKHIGVAPFYRDGRYGCYATWPPDPLRRQQEPVLLAIAHRSRRRHEPRAHWAYAL